MPRVHCSQLTQQQFAEVYEGPRQPVVITGLVDSWPAAAEWRDPRTLLAKYGSHRFKVGSDDDGYAVRMSLRQYMYYVHHPEHGQVDDSPLYIFDGAFGDRSVVSDSMVVVVVVVVLLVVGAAACLRARVAAVQHLRV